MCDRRILLARERRDQLVASPDGGRYCPFENGLKGFPEED